MSVRVACPTCSTLLPAGGRRCPSCGQPVAAASALPTQPHDGDAAVHGARTSRPTTAGPRFLPGALLADRYRIVALLGRGGMGEVYRADDLKLGQAVALKFLPAGIDASPGRLQRFLAEVRIARQVSHPNVCRIYDAGETDGQHFLSMEYIDGEDLASLLRRIGHLPKDKAIQIARQLCAGLTAAHAVGVLHRDMKPANIMIDGHGRARITDFGLAGFTGEIAGDEVFAGTPAYMAPEQLSGRGVSVRSDLYSLGLVLYELFTGRPAYRAASVKERRLQSETPPSAPSSLMEGFDPAVERVILRCLDADPVRRPSSALAIAAALPGGDPLAAALAAGETPPPELVAEAGGEGAASPGIAWGALALFVVAVAAVFALAPRTALLGMVPLDKPPEFLQERARELLAQAGHDRKPADSLFAFEANRPYIEDILRREGAGPGRWEILESAPPAGIRFWYRESPRDLVPIQGSSIVTWLEDPPDTVPGMARVGLDPEGRLISFLIVPGERAAPSPPQEPDWQPLLRATGIDAGTLEPVTPGWAPPVFADHRSAWTASWPGKPETLLRIEAAAAGGSPVWLRVIEPWTQPAEDPAAERGFWNRAARFQGALWPVLVIVVAGIVGLRNVRRGRGDRRGALRFALYLGAARMSWFFGAHHVASSAESELFLSHLAFAMLLVGLTYAFYLAVEPYARRLWPLMLVSWVRVLEGRFRDPLVGRDLLIGSAAGALVALATLLSTWIPAVLGGPGALPLWTPWSLEPLRGTLPALVSVAGVHTGALFEVIFPVTSLLIFRLLLRRTWAALIAAGLMGMVLFYPDTGSIAGYVVGYLLWLAIVWFVLFRVGLLAFAASFTILRLVEQAPLTPHPAPWHLGAMLLSLACIVTPALYGFWICRAGRPVFWDEVLEEPRR